MTEPIDRVLATLVRRMLADGLEVSEVSAALDLDPAAVRQLRHWHPAEKFSREEAKRYRDLLQYAAWKLPYWTAAADGRMELLPKEARSLRKLERAARHRARVEQGGIPSDLLPPIPPQGDQP